MASTIILTWMFNSTRGSLLLCQLLHQSGNAWATALLPVPNVAAFWIYYLLESLVAFGLIIVYGSARLSRQPVQQVAIPSTAA